MFGLTEKTYNEIIQIFSKYPEIEKVIIYGSRAKGNYRNGSDIDITLIGKKLKSDIIIELLTAIDETNLPYLFDISLYNSLDNPELKKHIDRAGKVFYSQTALQN